MLEKKTGFTLIELIVVISVISILSVFIAANYRAGERQLALERAAYQFSQDIRKAQAMAMASARCPADTACAGNVPAGGYGLYLERNNNDYYILYADINDNGEREEIERIYFEKPVVFSASSPASFSINFKPPDPIIIINVNNMNQDSATIIITLGLEPSKTKTITVNKAGLIEIE